MSRFKYSDEEMDVNKVLKMNQYNSEILSENQELKRVRKAADNSIDSSVKLLRSIGKDEEILKLSEEITGKNIGVVDERGEIAAMYKGIPQNDIGIRTDIIENIKKSIGMKMLIRSMAPEIIVADEIGSKEDVQEINYAVCSGIKGIFTAHGNSLEDLKLNPAIAELIEKNIFERLIFLDKNNKGKVNKIYALDKINKEYKII